MRMLLIVLFFLASCGPVATNKVKTEQLSGEDQELNQVACIEVYEPVCGSNGQTYSNSCHAGRAGVEIASQGECQGQASCVCPMNYAPVCGSNGQTYSNSCAANCAGVTFSSGACQ